MTTVAKCLRNAVALGSEIYLGSEIHAVDGEDPIAQPLVYTLTKTLIESDP